MPDRFVPIDTTMYSDYYRDLVAKGVINQYVLSYMDKNRNALKKNTVTPISSLMGLKCRLKWCQAWWNVE